MCQMREDRALRANPPSGSESFIEAHVGRMRFAAQCVQHRHLDSTNPLHYGRRHRFAITHVSQTFASILHKKKAVSFGLPVRQRKRKHLEITKHKRTFDDMRLRDEVASGPGTVVKSVNENALKILHRLSIGVDGKSSAAAGIA